MRNFTDEPGWQSAREDDDGVVRARPELSWMTQSDWRGGSRLSRRDGGARRSRAGVLLGSLLGIGALAAAGVYAARSMNVAELGPTAAVAGSESVDPYYGTVAVPARIGPVDAVSSTPASDAPASIPDSDAPAAADTPEASRTSADTSDPSNAAEPTDASGSPVKTPAGSAPNADMNPPEPSSAPDAREERSPTAPSPPPPETLSDDPDAYRPNTPENIAPSRSSREGATGVQEWRSDNPY